MPVRLGIRGKMILWIALPTLVIYVGVLGLAFAYLARDNRAEVVRNMTERAVNYADRFDGAFMELAAIAMTTARLMETAPDLTEQQIVAQLKANVLANDAVYGAAMAFEPGTYKSGSELFCPYAFRASNGIRTINITREVYDWYSDPHWQWWHVPKASGRPAWSDPYFDKGAGNVLMVTYSAPFARDGKFRGVTTVDVQVSKIRQRVGRAIVGDLDFVVLTPDGQFVYSRNESDIMSGRTLFDVVDAAGRPDLSEAARRIVADGSGVVDLAAWNGPPPRGWEYWAESRWIFYAPIQSTGWIFAAVVPESVALADVRSRLMLAAAALGVTLLLIVACILLAANHFIKPIQRLARGVQRIATGDLDHRVQVRSKDELGRLGHDVNRMARELNAHTEQIAQQRAKSREAMIFAVARLAESRDDDTGRHLERICRYVEILTAELARKDPNIDPGWARMVVQTAALHDIGKVSIPDAVLKKPGKLSDDERRMMQSHTTVGGDTLLALKRQWTEDDFLRIATEIAFAHHEHWDGKGYPFGLAGEDIGLAARIVAVADVYDALTTKRVYKDAMPHDQAKRIIVEGSGRQFDPRIVEAFLAVEDDFRKVAENLN